MSGGKVTYTRTGNVVFAQARLTLSSDFPPASNDIVAYGLPVPTGDVVITAISGSNTPFRMLLNGLGNLSTYYSGSAISASIDCSFVYIAN